MAQHPSRLFNAKSSLYIYIKYIGFGLPPFIACLFVCLFVWILWHINLCGLFNTKSVFIQINNLFHTIQLPYKIVLFQAIQFSISTQFSSILPTDRTLSGVTTPGQSGPGSDGYEEVLRFPQTSSITGTSASDCLVSYQDTRGGSLIPLAEMQCILQPHPTDEPL